MWVYNYRTATSKRIIYSAGVLMRKRWRQRKACIPSGVCKLSSYLFFNKTFKFFIDLAYVLYNAYNTEKIPLFPSRVLTVWSL
jgi:hypothetical protein